MFVSLLRKKCDWAPHLEGINLTYVDRRPNLEGLEFIGEATEYGSYGTEYIEKLKECKAVWIQLCLSLGPREGKSKKIYWTYR